VNRKARRAQAKERRRLMKSIRQLQKAFK